METKRRVLTIKEAAQLIDGLTEFRIRQMCKSGQLACFKAGKKFLISEDNLMKAVFGSDEGKEVGESTYREGYIESERERINKIFALRGV